LAGQSIPQQPVAKLPWGHNIALLTKLKDREARLWYATQAIEDGWSRKVLEHHIATRRYASDLGTRKRRGAFHVAVDEVARASAQCTIVSRSGQT
jgi:hypothetical protein